MVCTQEAVKGVRDGPQPREAISTMVAMMMHNEEYGPTLVMAWRVACDERESPADAGNKHMAASATLHCKLQRAQSVPAALLGGFVATHLPYHVHICYRPGTRPIPFGKASRLASSNPTPLCEVREKCIASQMSLRHHTILF